VCCRQGPPDLSSIWVGIGDGNARGTSLIQDGTEEDVSAAGRASYYFWVEAFPKPQQVVTNLAVHRGDEVGASAAYNVRVRGDATFVLCVLSRNTCVSGSEPAARPDNHAEWIVERTAFCNTRDRRFWLPALARFSVVRFINGYYDLSSRGNLVHRISNGRPAITYMISPASRPSIIATPSSPLGNGGTAFNVTWRGYGRPINTGARC
jgi:hypothetical protein